jgi:hypothetical protein
MPKSVFTFVHLSMPQGKLELFIAPVGSEVLKEPPQETFVAGSRAGKDELDPVTGGEVKQFVDINRKLEECEAFLPVLLM